MSTPIDPNKHSVPTGAAVYLRKPISAKLKTIDRLIRLNEGSKGYVADSTLDFEILFASQHSDHPLFVIFSWMVVTDFLEADLPFAIVNEIPAWKAQDYAEIAKNWSGHRVEINLNY